MQKSLLSIFLIILSLSNFSHTKAQVLDSTMAVVSTSGCVECGQVKSIATLNNTIYIGGLFNYVGPRTGSGVPVDINTGLVKAQFPKLKGSIYTVISDGKGGWFVGGSFKVVNAPHFAHLIHINPDYTLDLSWNLVLSNHNVYSLAISNNILYVGGSFTGIGGAARSNIAAFDLNSRQVTDWNPNPDYDVKTIIILNNNILVGGSFTNIGGAQRNFLAKLDPVTGLATPWNPSITGTGLPFQTHVNTAAVYNNLIYVGGNFTSIGGQERKNIAAIDLNSGQVTDWYPNPSSEIMPAEINSIVISKNSVYAGGQNFTIEGPTRNGLAAFDVNTGTVNSSMPIIPGIILTLAIANNTLFIGGHFSTINGQVRNKVGAIDISTGQVTSWNPIAGGGVQAISATNNAVFIGGDFLSINGKLRKNIASIDAITGKVTDWDPQADATVTALNAIGNRIYAGGIFKSIGGQERNGIAAFDITTGQVTPWNPKPDNFSPNMALTEDNIYLSGDNFENIGGKPRNRIAAVNPVSGLATSWNPNSNGPVLCMAVKNDLVYVGGNFTSIGGAARKNIAALDITTGLATSWNPNVNNFVRSIVPSDSVIYIGGAFTTVGGQSRNYIAALDLITGFPTSWNPNANQSVIAMAISKDIVYVGGVFGKIGNESRANLAAIDKNTGLATSWKPFKDHAYDIYLSQSEVSAIAITETSIYVAGKFESKFAAFGGRPKPTDNKPKNNMIRGKIFADTNKNCIKEPSEDSLANFVVVAKPGPYFAYSDIHGNYSLAVDTGTYTVTQVIPKSKNQLVQQICPANQGGYTTTFNSYNNVVQDLNFANEIIPCPQLLASVTANRRRRCFRNNTIVSYNNIGLASADGVRIHIKFPEYVVPISSNVAWTIDKDSVYIFDIGILGAKQQGSISIVDSVICGNSAIRDLTQCTRVWTTSITNCSTKNPPSPDWDKSDIMLKAKCADNGFVKLSIHNTGTGHMADSSSFRIYLDAQLVFQHKFKLNAGDSLLLQVPANGQTLRLEADQRPFHPSKEQTNISIEACGVNSEGKVSTGYVAQFPQDDEGPEVAIECLPIIDSYDPNDKLVLPGGVTENHYTPTNKALDYTIRFQNTGSDYAYKVVVVDTLSEHLDMSTFQMGAASHAYKLNISGKGLPVLTWTFNNINLPDSTRDQLGSNGFIKFSIKPLAGIAEKTVVENYADIFFDFNEPVRTNTVFNSIYDVPAPVVNNEKVIICQTNAVAFAGANRSFCEQDTIYLQANAPMAGQGTWILIKGAAKIQNLTNPTSLVTNLGYGENIFEWKLPTNSCSTASTSSTVTIFRKPAPGTPVITQKGADSLFCNISGTTYEWYRNGTKIDQTGQQIQASESGNYTVKVTLDGCNSSLSQVFNYQKTPTGLEEYGAQVKVYPNPATSSVFIELPANWQAILTLSDAMGRAVKESMLTRGEPRVELTLTGVKAGMYILHITTTDGTIVKKLIVR